MEGSVQAPPPPLAHPALRKRLWLLVALPLAALWLYGLVVFITTHAPFEATLPRQRQPSADLQNLALWDLGPTVRASSYLADWINHHHPLFVVDGKASPDLVEKWASANSDEHPWIEIRWREHHTLEKVVLRHAGSVEGSHLTARKYRILCLRDGGQQQDAPQLAIDNNSEAIASHDLHCDDARGVRIELERNDKEHNDKEIVRLFEVETWGR